MRSATEYHFEDLADMLGWIVASIALAILFGWMASTIHDAPLGIQDEDGFRFAEPSRDLPNWMRPHRWHDPSRPFARAYGILLSPM